MKSFASFIRNIGGNIGIITAIMIFPLMTVTGMAIDYSRFLNLRDHLQSSLDAAGLATAQFQASSPVELDQPTLKAYAENFFRSNLRQDLTELEWDFGFNRIPGDFSIEPPVIDQFELSVDLNYPTLFRNFMTVKELEDEIVTYIALGNRSVEVALVLDNSGSMSGDRIETLKTEAKKLVDIVHNSASFSSVPQPVQFSLVPFAGSVNVGTQHEDARWMDWKGWSPVHHENFDWENTYRSTNNTRIRDIDGFPAGFQEKEIDGWEWKSRFDVFDMLDTDWGGCVEMRPWPYNTMDVYTRVNRGYRKVRDSFDIDGDGEGDGTSALFVPYFAPDEPDDRFAEDSADFTDLGIAPNTDHDADDDNYRNDYLYDFQDYNPVSPNQIIQLYTDENDGNPAFDQEGSVRQINRTNWMFKYQRNQQYNGSLDDDHGPNSGCTTQAITDLSTNRDLINTQIDSMEADGTTNIQQGLTWGWRTLSPVEPFTNGREKTDPRNMKFVIVLTDGNNFYSTDGDSTPNESAYGSWGYMRPDSHDLKNPVNGLATHNRIAEGLDAADLVDTIYQNTLFDLTPNSNAEFETLMNVHTNQACNNIKNDGVTIYTVAFDVPTTGGVRNLLQACAGSGVLNGEPVILNGQFYYDVDGNDLADAFASIASQIATLRISG